MSWTSSYHIPTAPQTNSRSTTTIYAVPVFDDLWIFQARVCWDTYTTELDLTVFKTKTHEMIKEVVGFPKKFRSWLQHCVVHDNNVYIAGKRLAAGTSLIYKLNTTTMKFIPILNVHGLEHACEIKAMLPHEVRSRLANMWDWKSYEHENGIKWANVKKYREALKVEIDNLAQNGLIDEYRQRSLIGVLVNAPE